MTKTKTTKANINFEQELWKAANELRGAVSENKFGCVAFKGYR